MLPRAARKTLDTMPLKSIRRTANLPGELEEDFEKRWLELGYQSFSAYLVGLALYDLWSKRAHKLTVPLMNKPAVIRDKIIAEIKEIYNSTDESKTRPGGWFERELKRLLDEAKGEQSPPQV